MDGGLDISLASRRLMIMFWSMLILGVLWLVRRPEIGLQRKPILEVPSPDPALVMLKEFCARGAITKQQFEEMRRDLEADRPDRSQ